MEKIAATLSTPWTTCTFHTITIHFKERRIPANDYILFDKLLHVQKFLLGSISSTTLFAMDSDNILNVVTKAALILIYL